MLNIDNNKTVYKTAFLHLGFRPFFAGAGVYAVIAMLVWLAQYSFGWQPGLTYTTPSIWHAHEMIYGYSAAVIAGFLLTAIRNWTGSQTLHGVPLLLLFLLWATARLLPLLWPSVSLPIIFALDCLFNILLTVAAALPILKKRQWGHVSILFILLLFTTTHFIFYTGVNTQSMQTIHMGLYGGLYLVMLMIFVMGRRVIPFFIEKGVDETVQLRNYRWLDIGSILLFAVFIITEITQLNPVIGGVLATLLFWLHLFRLFGWYTPGIWKKPLLWSLYLAYGFLIAGFALKAASVFMNVSPFLATHAFTVGGIGLMTLGMMSRVALGHTGRNVFEPPPILFWFFAVLLLSAVMRVILPLVDVNNTLLWITLSQWLWIIAFGLYSAAYVPLLVKPRIDGRYG